MEVDGLGPGNVKKIIAAGYTSVPQIIGMSEEDFLKTNNKEYELSIYTQKNGFNVKGFEKYKIVYDSDMTDNECWVNMLNSDIIIGGNSAFSTSIGMLTDGIFIHTQTDNLPLMDDWLYGSELTHDKLKMYL